MDEAQEILTRIKTVMESAKKEKSSESETSEKTNFNVTSKCPLGMCDGSGVILLDEHGFNTKICDCVKLMNKRNKLKFANVPEEFKELKVGEFETDIYEKPESKSLARSAKKWAIEYVKRFEIFKTDGKGLYFYSSEKGSGKTRLMISVGNALINTYNTGVKFVTTNELLDNIRFSFGKKDEERNTYESLMNDIKETEILLLDDIGAERPSDWVNDVFYSILNDRMTHKKVTLFTSNLAMEQLPYNDRITSRIFKMALPVKMPEESVRSKMAMAENEKYLKMIMGD